MLKWSFYCEKYPAVVTMENDLLSARPPAFISFSFSLIIIGFNHIFLLMLGKICAGGYLSMGRWWWQVIYNLFFSVMYSFISKRKLSFYLSQTHLGYLCISQFLPAPRPHNDEILAPELVLDCIVTSFPISCDILIYKYLFMLLTIDTQLRKFLYMTLLRMNWRQMLMDKVINPWLLYLKLKNYQTPLF
jgi:hypothetical protein